MREAQIRQLREKWTRHAAGVDVSENADVSENYE